LIQIPPASVDQSKPRDDINRYSFAPCGLWGCKNGPAPFPGWMSYKATKPGLVCLSYLSMLYIVVY